MAEPLLSDHGFDLVGYTELLERARRKAGLASTDTEQQDVGAKGEGEVPGGSRLGNGQQRRGGVEAGKRAL